MADKISASLTKTIQGSDLQGLFLSGMLGAVPSLPENLKNLRESLKLTQETVAERSGLSQSRVSKYERGEATPDLDTLLKLAVGLEQPLDVIVLGLEPRYDLTRHSSPKGSVLPTGGAVDPASARALDRLALYETRLREIEDVASQLVKIAVDTRKAGREGGPTRKALPGRGRGNRKAG